MRFSLFCFQTQILIYLEVISGQSLFALIFGVLYTQQSNIAQSVFIVQPP